MSSGYYLMGATTGTLDDIMALGDFWLPFEGK